MEEIGVELEGNLCGVLVRVDGALDLRLSGGCLESVEPFGDDGERTIPNRARVRVDLCSHRREEAAPWEHAALDVREELLAQGPEPSGRGRSAKRGLDHLGAEDLIRGLERRQLKLLLGAEVREQPTLAQPDGRGESCDRKALDAFDGDEAGGLPENRVAAPRLRLSPA